MRLLHVTLAIKKLLPRRMRSAPSFFFFKCYRVSNEAQHAVADLQPHLIECARVPNYAAAEARAVRSLHVEFANVAEA